MTGTGDDLGGQPAATGVADEVRAIIGAAMRLAEAIRVDAERRAEETLRDAREEAARHLEDAHREAEVLRATEARRAAAAERVAEHSAAVSAELTSVTLARRQLDAALGALAGAAERMSGAAQEEHVSFPPPREAAAGESGAGAAPGRDAGGAPPAGERRDDQAANRMSGPRLVAEQMALAGSSRAEVAAHLQRTFQLPALHEVLDEVFEGPGPQRASGG